MFFNGRSPLDCEKLQFFSEPIKCAKDSDCPDYLACGEDEECLAPPCPNCTVNAHCEASNHKGIWNCNSGYPLGDPLEGCKHKQSWLYNLYSSFCHIQSFRMQNRLRLPRSPCMWRRCRVCKSTLSGLCCQCSLWKKQSHRHLHLQLRLWRRPLSWRLHNWYW